MSNRNIIEVINKIKPIFIEQGLSTSELDSIIDSKKFSPPEMDNVHWIRLQAELVDIADDYFDKPYEQFPDWLKKISDIITNKTSD